MKNYLLNGAKAALLAAALFVAMLVPDGLSKAQVVTQLPTYVNPNNGAITDFGNGPLELRVYQGSLSLITSQGNNGSANSADAGTTTLTLTSTPTTPPCVGCVISGSGITPGTTVSAYNGTTGITLSSAMTVPANTLITWGAACPATLFGFGPAMQIQANVGADLPLYTYARICGSSPNSAGAAVLTFPIGAH